jgi:zinc/manganese transport system substrate-binding protein
VTVRLHRPRSGLLAALLGALLLATACSGAGGDAPTAARGGHTLTVVASTNVWGDVVSRIAGPGVEVRSILTDPAADPHSYESTPADAAEISGADLVVYNGGGYDEWMTRVLDTDPAVRDRSVEAFALRGDQADDNEHVWFDPAAVKGVITQVTERLAAVEPAQADALRGRAAAFTAEVDVLAGRLAAIGRARPGTRVVSTEPIAHYLLATAGVADVTPPAFVEAVEEESDPPVAALTTTRDLLAARQAAALVFNPQTETPVVEQVRTAAQQAGLPVVEVTETLPPDATWTSWVGGLRDALAQAVGAPA